MKGFTLLEVMIVVVVIGIISSMTLVKMGGGGQSQWQQQEALRLMELFKLSSQQAMVTGTPLGLELFRDGYRFLNLQGERWQPEQRDALFRQRTVQAKLHLALQLGNRPIALTALAQPNALPKPQIVFTPDGDTSLFQILISVDNSTERLSLANTAKDGLTIKTLMADRPL